MEPLSKIQETIEGYNLFLWDIVKQADKTETVQEYVNHLVELNKRGEYESWMKSRDDNNEVRWSNVMWWVAASINYNNLTLQRIANNRFRNSHLDKIEKNSTMKNKSKFKPQLVEAWHAYCKQNDYDFYIFEMARINGVEYDI